jgi:hypothetical protein
MQLRESALNTLRHQNFGKQVSPRNLSTRLGFCLWALLLESGCMLLLVAATPEKKDVSTLHSGSYRTDVVAKLGEPDSISYSEGKEIDVYTVDPEGDEPSTKRTNVKGFATWDALFLGTPEIIYGWTVPVNTLLVDLAGMRDDDIVYTVTYSADGKVESVTKSKKKKPFWRPNT